MRTFSNDIRVTHRVLGVNLCLNINNILAFGGTHRLPTIILSAPLSELLLRASTPCLSPRPLENGAGRSSCVHCITRGVTRVGYVAPSRILRGACGGTVGLFGV